MMRQKNKKFPCKDLSLIFADSIFLLKISYATFIDLFVKYLLHCALFVFLVPIFLNKAHKCTVVIVIKKVFNN